jgi:hypothetical protein
MYPAHAGATLTCKRWCAGQRLTPRCTLTILEHLLCGLVRAALVAWNAVLCRSEAALRARSPASTSCGLGREDGTLWNDKQLLARDGTTNS